MMSNELRIGNFVNHISFGVVPIKGINLESLKTQYKENEFWDDIIQHQPIALTEKWLVKFGFYENRNNNSWQIDSNLGFSIWGRIKTGFNVFVNSDDCGNAIFNVHQLQNLYFALTGEELIIKT